MTVQWSAGVRNARLDAWETAIGVTPFLRIYSGTPPASVAAALSGNTLLVEYHLASDWAANAATGQKTFNGLPLATTAVGGAAGTLATFYRIYAADGTTCHEQGTITTTGGGGDMTVDNASIATGQNVQVLSFTKIEPGA